MKYRLNAKSGLARTLLVACATATLLPGIALSQVPVDENGEIIGEYVSNNVGISAADTSLPAIGNEEIPLLSAVDLEELVGPIALYPDDLLAIVLPASAYPLQIVEAARFLEALENDPSLKPDPEWDDSVVALVNYPEVVELLNDDIDWTWRLGEAVVSQQTDVVAAIETFRDRAYAAGNLKSDDYQNVTHDEGIIEIVPIADDVIYVPYYEPERVVVYQPRPVYYYYPRPYPVYYYPYASTHAFNRGYFWGVTTAFTIGWYSDSLNVFHHSYRGHPYYGHSYWNRWWYRRPTVSIHNNTYVSRNTNVTINRYYGGDRWRPRANRRDFVDDKRVTRNRHYPSPRSGATRSDTATSRLPRSTGQRRTTANNDTVSRERAVAPRQRTSSQSTREPVQFRPRTRTEATRQRHEEPRERLQEQRQSRRVDNKQRRTQPTPKLRRSKPVVQTRRTEPVVQARRSEPQRQTRRAEPQRQARRVEPQRQTRRAEPQRQARQVEPQRQTRRAEPQRQARRVEPQQQSRRAAPQRQQRVEQRSTKRKAERKTEQRSGRRAERASSRSR